jgi:pyruvate dehydrogenase E1 component beta subunit
MHTPGLRLAMPATVADAYHLLRQSLLQPDPVVFIEHKSLYTLTEEVDLVADEIPWAKASVRRRGSDIVLIAYSRQVHNAMQAAESLQASGINASVIDLRTLNPLDFNTIKAEIERIGRVAVVSEGAMTSGVAAELAARISEECFDFLHDPVIRIAGEDIPISVSAALESGSVPDVDLIVDTASRLMA